MNGSLDWNRCVFWCAKVIPKSFAKLAQVSFRQIPEPIWKIITLNRVYKRVCQVNLQKMRGKAESFHIEGMLRYRIRKNHIAPQWSTVNWFGTAPITLATAHSFFCPFLWAKSVSSATWKRFAWTLSIIQYISIMECFCAYLPYLTKTYLVNGTFTQFKRKKIKCVCKCDIVLCSKFSCYQVFLNHEF